ncbi:MAG: ATP-dependent helicase [Desulfobulbus sp.]|nr:ATP-dependent helicase [Desulfobulbus sp.]
MLERATSKQSYQRIVTDLNNRDQEKIVTAGNEKNMLVLAGPGAGKTRVVAHRVAYLLRVARINSKAILVLCFNRSSIVSLRQRLHDLIGNDMMGVTLLTFHGLALRLTGRSLVTQSRAEKQEEIDFAEVILEANRLLKGESEVMGFGDIPSDYALVGRFSHILVDEYQDIDAAQYELVSLVAGKSSEEGDRKMAILAVGDDDQNIYRFRGASIEFIRKFQQDYDADVHYLIENYRSTANVIAAANCLIAHNSDRMKTGYPICINKARKNLPAGGNWQQTDSIVQGRVQILDVKDSDTQATVLLEELQRLSRIGSVDLSHCAVLAREWKDLDRVRSQCEDKGIPVSLCWGRHSGFPRLTRIKENAQLLEFLREIGAERLCAGEILTVLEQMWPVGTLWSDNLRNLLLEWQEETNNSLQPVSAILEYLYEVLTEQGRSKSMGNGLFLATAHAVKGLEFDHVFILGDSWQGVSASTIEDERRLYYVSMSRARETLHLFSLAFSGNPHTSTLSGDFFIRRKFHAPIKEKKPARTYHLLGMEDVFIDFAGLQPEQHPTRLALREIKAGDAVHIDERYSKLELVNKHGITIARLSRKAQDEWADKIQNIKEVRVVALVQRYKKELVDKTFQARCKGETWEVPIVEVVC